MRRVNLVLLVLIFLNSLAVGGLAKEAKYKITPDVIYGHKAGMALTFDVIQPHEPNGAGVLFMVSGAWVSMWVPPDTWVAEQPPLGMTHFRDLLDRGFTLFIVRHGSSPQFKVPEAVADVQRAVRYIRHHAKDFQVDPDRLGVCGGSAGGHLSLMLGVASDDGKKDSKDEVEHSSDRVAAIVAYFPPVDLRQWVGDKRFPALHFDEKLAESVSPIVFVTKDDPPTLLIHGDKDDLVKLDNSERILEAFKKEGVASELIVIEGAGHGFLGGNGKRASDALAAWFETYLAKPNSEIRVSNDKSTEKATSGN
jgi:acetyl esterase/lipase